MRGGAVTLTVVISAALHVGLATGLVAVAQKREVRRRAISVAVQDAKKKEPPKAKPPAPPKPIAHAAPPKVAPAAPAPSAAPEHVAHAAAVATTVAMGNGGGGLDVGPGIGLHGRADAPAPAPAPVKVASAMSDARTRKMKEEAGADAPCAEEPTKPEAIVKTPLDYSVRPQAQADGVEGKFRARVTVDSDGEVSNVEVQVSIEPAFDAALIAAIKTWRFKPAMACGKAIAGGTFVVSRTFELGD